MKSKATYFLCLSFIGLAGCVGPQPSYTPTIGGTLPAKVNVGTIAVAEKAEGNSGALSYIGAIYQQAVPAEFANMDGVNDAGKCVLDGTLDSYVTSRSVGAAEGVSVMTFTLKDRRDLRLFIGTYTAKQEFSGFSDASASQVSLNKLPTETIRKLVRDQAFLSALKNECR